MRRSVLPSLVGLGLLLAGCRDDLKQMSTGWSAVKAEWQTKAEVLKLDDAEQAKRFVALCSFAGLDPGNVASKSCVELKVTDQADRAQLEALLTGIARQEVAVDQSVGRGKRLAASAAIETAKEEVTMLFARVTDSAQLRREALKGLQLAVTQELEAAKTAAIVAETKALLWRRASIDRTPLELTDIRFTQGTAELEGPEAGKQRQLQELLVWANSCPSLTFSVAAHESKELAPAQAQTLTDGRALAVLKFLVANGVAPAKIVSATGNGAKRPIADEPAATSAAAKAMNPDELEALRNKNRRITVQAVGVCVEGERAELSRP